MAVTVTLQTVSPYSLRYLLLGDGAATSTDVLQTALVADAAPGSLRKLLENAVTDAVWDALDFNPRLLLTIHSVSAGIASPGLNFVTGPRALRITSPATVETWILDLNFKHSTGR